MDVDRPARHRAVVAEHFHAVDQRDDAVGLVADQPRQHAVFGRGRLLQQLRRAADAGQRILDFMRQHRGQRDHRARRAAMRQLPVHLVGDGALLQHHDDMAGPLGERGDVQIDLAVAADARRAEIDLVFVDRRAARAHLVDQRQQRTAERHQLLQRLPPQELRRNLEEGFGGDIGVDDPAVGRTSSTGLGSALRMASPSEGTARRCSAADVMRQHSMRNRRTRPAAIGAPGADPPTSGSSAASPSASPPARGCTGLRPPAPSRDVSRGVPIRAVMAADFVIERAHMRELLGQRRRRLRLSGFEPAADLARQPGLTLRAAADHHGVRRPTLPAPRPPSRMK